MVADYPKAQGACTSPEGVFYSVFLATSVHHKFTPVLPGGPSPCPGHYSRAFGYYAASARSPCALAFSCPVKTGKAGERSPVPTPLSSSTPGCLLCVERTSEQTVPDPVTGTSAAFLFRVGCISHFHPSWMMTLTQVSCVNISTRS